MGRVEYKTAKLREYDIQLMRRRMSSQQIADFYGITKKCLYKWCWRHHFSLNPLTTDELLEEIAEKNPKEIALEYGVSLNSVYYRLKQINGGIRYAKKR